MKLPSISGKELCKLVEKVGFSLVRISGSHHLYKHVDGRINKGCQAFCDVF